MKKSLIVFLTVFIALASCWAAGVELGTTSNLMYVSIQDTKSVLADVHLDMTTGTEVSEHVSIFGDFEAGYAFNIYNKDRFYGVPDSVNCFIGSGVGFRFDKFIFSPVLGLRVLNVGQSANFYSFLEAGTDFRYIFGQTKHFLWSVCAPVRFAFSANGIIVSSGLSFKCAFGGDK